MANIVLLDDKGVAQTYTGINSATFNTAEGGLVTFTAPEEHNADYNLLQQLLTDYSDEYTFYTTSTQYGTYVTSNMYDFGIWLITNGNAYKILDSGSFLSSGIAGKFIYFAQKSVWQNDNTLAPNSIYYHDGNAEHTVIEVYASTSAATNWNVYSNNGLCVANASNQRACVLFHDDFAAPVVVTNMVAGTVIGTDYSVIISLTDGCYLLQSNNPYSYGGPLLVHTNGSVTCFERFSSGNYGMPNVCTQISDTLFACGSTTSNSPLVIINIANDTFEVKSETSLGIPFHYHVASSTLFLVNGSTCKYFCFADNTSGSVSGTISANHKEYIAITNGCVYCVGSMTRPDKSILTTPFTQTQISSGSLGSLNYGFSILYCASRSIIFTTSTGRYDWSSLYTNSGALALIAATRLTINNGQQSEYNEPVYVLNANTGVCVAATIDGASVTSYIRAALIDVDREVRSSVTYLTYLMVRPDVYYAGTDVFYVKLGSSTYNKKLLRVSLSSLGALETIYTFTAEYSGYTIGTDISQTYKNTIMQGAVNNPTLYTKFIYQSAIRGAVDTGPARIYYSNAFGTADSSYKTCIIIKPNKNPIIFTKTNFLNSSYCFSCLNFSLRPIRNNIYAGVDGNCCLFLLNLDDDEHPIIDTFTIQGTDTTQPVRLHMTSTDTYGTFNISPFTSENAIQYLETCELSLDDNTSCIAISLWPSVALISCDFTKYLGGNSAFGENGNNCLPCSFNTFANVHAVRAFDFTNADIISYTGDITTDTYSIILQAKAAPRLCACIGRDTTTSVFYMTTNTYNKMLGNITDVSYLFIGHTSTGALYSRSKDTSGASGSTTSPYAYAIHYFPFRYTPSSTTVTRAFKNGYNWTEMYPGSEDGLYEIFREGLPQDRYLIWNDATKTITEVIVSDNNE